MRDMDNRHGVILLETTEVIFRIYEITDHEWKLSHYHSSLIPAYQQLESATILEIIGSFFTTEYEQHIAVWKICSRHYPKALIRELSRAIDISIEDISLHREQE